MCFGLNGGSNREKEYGSMTRHVHRKAEGFSDNESDDVAFSDEEVNPTPTKFPKQQANVRYTQSKLGN